MSPFLSDWDDGQEEMRGPALAQIPLLTGAIGQFMGVVKNPTRSVWWYTKSKEYTKTLKCRKKIPWSVVKTQPGAFGRQQKSETSTKT